MATSFFLLKGDDSSLTKQTLELFLFRVAVAGFPVVPLLPLYWSIG